MFPVSGEFLIEIGSLTTSHQFDRDQRRVTQSPAPERPNTAERDL